MKIRQKIILMIMAVVLTGGVLTLLLVNIYSRFILTELIGDDVMSLTQQGMGSVDRIIYRRIERWQAYAASNDDLLDFLNESNDSFSRLSDRDGYISQIDKEWQAAGKEEITPFMNELIDNPLSEGLRRRADFYNEKYGYEIFPEFFITNKYGANVAQTGKTSDYYQGDEECWQKAVADGVYVSQLTYDESSGFNSLAICLKIADQAENFLGVAKISYNIDDIFDVIDEIKSDNPDSAHSNHQTMDIKLMDGSGRVIYCTKEGFKNFSETLPAVGEHLKNGEPQGYFTAINELGVEKLYAYSGSSGYKDFPGSGWYLVISHDTKEIFAPINDLNWIILLIIMISAAIALAIGLVFSSLIAKPIKKLRRGAEIIASGDLEHRVGTDNKDEIGQLSRSFDKMSAAVKKSRAEVDRKVEEQTREIVAKREELENQQKAILNILEDVEEEKNNVSLERDKINAILHSIGDAVFVVDEHLRITMFNQIAADISGFGSDEALGKKYDQILRFIFEKDGKVNDLFIKEAIRTGQIQEMANHTLLVKRDGIKVPVADSAAPLKNKAGKIIGCVVVFRDVTKEREVDRMKTEFVSVASHQLRTPLTAIRWTLEELAGDEIGELNEQQRDYVNQSLDSNKRMIDLVNDLLNVSRLETGRLSVEPKPTDLTELVAGVVKEYGSVAKAKNCRIVFQAPKPKLKKINIDQSLIRQVVANFVSNAVKYSIGGKNCQVEIKLKSDNKNVIFSAKDKGLGVPKKAQGRIFEKFFRADNVIKLETEGSGLGLYICKMIIEVSGGRVWFESEEGKGSTFYFSLPLAGSKAIKGEKKLAE